MLVERVQRLRINQLCLFFKHFGKLYILIQRYYYPYFYDTIFSLLCCIYFSRELSLRSGLFVSRERFDYVNSSHYAIRLIEQFARKRSKSDSTKLRW